MKFSTRFENLLEERGLTQRQLALKLHIAPSTLNGYLRRGREPEFKILIQLAEFFGVSTDYLLGVTDIRQPVLSPECYDDKESDLLSTYRTLSPQEQNYLIKQAHMFHGDDLDNP